MRIRVGRVPHCNIHTETLSLIRAKILSEGRPDFDHTTTTCLTYEFESSDGNLNKGNA